MGIKNIIVGVDHSDRGDMALQRANEIALFHDAHMIVEYSLDVGTASRLRGLLERVALEETQERSAALLGGEAASLEVRVDAGRPYEVMRDVSVERDADLIVLGAHRTGDGPPGLSGSTARRLINVAPAPVLITVSEPTGGYENVLVGYDDSAAAREALRFALALAPNARFTIVNACLIPFSARRAEPALTRQFEDDARRMVSEALQHDPQAAASADRIKVVVRAGDALGVILETQRERQPDLLVLGTSMPALYRQVFGGGIADLIAADPPCDLLVVKV